MATMNFIMPPELKHGFCDRTEKENKVKHTWHPSGQSRSIIGGRVAIEGVCKHCKQREWTETSHLEFTMLQDYWKELR